MLLRYHAQLFFCMLLASAAANAQSEHPVKPMAKDAHPSFEVATIKPHDPASKESGFNVDGGRLSIHDEDLVAILMISFSIYRSQIAGLPASLAHERWDIEGIADTPGEPNRYQQQELLQKLLAERFGLKFHREQRELPVYLMQVAKGGPKLKPAAKPEEPTDQRFHGEDNVAILEYTSTDMSDFVMGESLVLDQPLVDHTGLTGKYDFTLRYNFRETTVDSAAVPGLFTAVQEQLGLKFVPTKALADVMVIDHIDRPSAN